MQNPTILSLSFKKVEKKTKQNKTKNKKYLPKDYLRNTDTFTYTKNM